MAENYFLELSNVNVNDKTEKKNGLTYLSWAWAWAEVMKRYPKSAYEILPWEYDEKLGYMCWTSVTIEGDKRLMWLPVMDGANRAMKADPYTYTVKSYGKLVEKSVEAATMFDINKTIMRCLVKNLAMFGLGLYIYAGEDLPEDEKAAPQDNVKQFNEVVNKSVACDECKKPIGAYKNMTAAHLAAYTKKKYGKALCAECAEQYARQAKKEALEQPPQGLLEGMSEDAD